jgi:hypothetical protein
MLDSSAFPPDTSITVRMSRRIVESAMASIFIAGPGSPQRAELSLGGGEAGAPRGFPLAAGERASIEVVIDFSHDADHLAKYALVATQTQSGLIAGRLTMEITAVRELEDFYFGNPRSREAHISTCPFWSRLGPASRVPYERIEDLIARGYNGCVYCLPDADTDRVH